MSRFTYVDSDELKMAYRNGWVSLTVYRVIQRLEQRATFAEIFLVRKDIETAQANGDGTCRSVKELTVESQRVVRRYLVGS